ncbi:glycosyltransferase family 39 protein [Amycolatopsis acidicola]|uniref:Glycosyltransferase family 39 protein n=1 Tax=Amycolatopsis acidicola TaxID=2596893 RepID=A0A5N0V5C4_9PSEU|nr:glycosyltransferase family 39 protein [Amycolatopsis acidicola]KAA9161566.1 glycosyltransferase family 39 protein [Amycolatopsis acidicola]
MDSPAKAPEAPVTEGRESLPSFARLPVFGIAAAAGVLLLALSGRFGYFGDELYFLVSGKYHFAWGYADNPWLVPALASLMDTIAPGSVVALRVPAMLLTVGGIVLTALIAREMGGGRRAQAIAAAAFATSLQLLASGHLLATYTVDPFLWTLTCWLVVRWLRTRQDRLLLLAGLATALAMQGKFLIVFFWLGLGIAALITGPRELLRRPLLWVGAVITVAVTVPTVLWQARNGWPYFDMQAIVAEQVNRFMGGPGLFAPLAIVFAGLPAGAFLVCHGTWQLLRSEKYRFLGVTALLVTLIFIVTVGRYYYVSGLYGLVFAASAVRIEQHRPARWWRWVPTWPVFVVTAAVSVFAGLPVQPLSAITNTNFVASGSYGWPQLVDTVAAAYHQLPPPEQQHAVLMGDTYWQASALDFYGRQQGLPAAYGPERGSWYNGEPPADAGPVLYTGSDPAQLSRFFGDVRQVATVRIATKPDNVNQNVPVYLCHAPRAPWPRLWQQMHRA